MTETRKIAAILVADVVGYSRLAGADEDRTLSRLRSLRGDLIDPAIAAHHGCIVKRTGISVLNQCGSTRPQLIQADEAIYRLRLSASDPAHAKGGRNV